MRILITGINGFIGQSVCHKLISNNEVAGIGRLTKAFNDEISYLKVNIADAKSTDCILDKVNGKIDIIVHLAAEISNDIQKLYETNCTGTQNMVELAKKANCKKFVYLSSIPIIGYPCELPITEEHQIKPRTIYHYTKYFGEQITEQLAAYGIDNVSLRIASPIGVNMKKDKILSMFIQKALEENNIEVWGNGNRIQNYIDVEDIAQAIEQVICTHKVKGTFNLSGTSISDYELALLCKKVTQSCSSIIVNNEELLSDNEKWIISAEKAKYAIGYKQRHTLEESVLKIADFYRRAI